MVVVIFIDGFSKKDAPGSLWSPAQTNLGIMGVGELGMAFGLFMAGVSLFYSQPAVDMCTILTDVVVCQQFSGHAVIPSLARDMMEPSQFDTVMNYAFVSRLLQN